MTPTRPVYIRISDQQAGINGSESNSFLCIFPRIYVRIDPAGEIAETRVEGFTTDASATVQIFAVDVDSCSGEETERSWGTSVPRSAAVQGFWQFRSSDPSYVCCISEFDAKETYLCRLVSLHSLEKSESAFQQEPSIHPTESPLENTLLLILQMAIFSPSYSCWVIPCSLTSSTSFHSLLKEVAHGLVAFQDNLRLPLALSSNNSILGPVSPNPHKSPVILMPQSLMQALTLQR
jgi:hypothetical protein